MSTATLDRGAALDRLFGPVVPIAERINAWHERCCQAANEALECAFAAGALLIDVKADCSHGEWGRWLADSFSGSDRTAREYSGAKWRAC